MSLKEKLATTERELGDVSKEIGKLSESSKATFRKDQARIQDCLRSAVRTIQGAQTALLVEKDASDAVPGAFSTDDEEQQHPSSLHEPLQKLDQVSSESLEHVSECYRDAHDLNAKLESIANTSGQHADACDSQLRKARLDVLTKQKDQQIAREHIEECQTEMSQLSAKMEKTSDKRDGLRVGRVLMWGAALAYPPAAIVAAGMEVGAHNIRKKTRELKSKKETLETKNTSLHQEVADLGHSIKELQSNVQQARKLSQRCQSLSADLKKYLEEIEEMMKKFLDLKMATDNFAASTRTWTDQARLIKEVSDDNDDDDDGVRRLTLRLLEDIDQSQKSQTLNRLITSSKGGLLDEDCSVTLEELLDLPPAVVERLKKTTRRKQLIHTDTVELADDIWAL